MDEILMEINANPLLTAIVGGLMVAFVGGVVGLAVKRFDHKRSFSTVNNYYVVEGASSFVDVVGGDADGYLGADGTCEAELGPLLDDEESEESSASAPLINGDIIVFENGGTLENPHNLGNYQRESPYIIPMYVRICVEDVAGTVVASVGEEGQQLTEVAVLRGDLILGYQMSRDDVDFLAECDDYTADCGAGAYEILDEGIFSEQDIFVIHSYQMSADLLDRGKAGYYLDIVPQIVFENSNVMPTMLCYLVATTPGYHEKAAEKSSLDSRSVDVRSPLLLPENGFVASQSRLLLYRSVDDIKLARC